MLPVPGAGHHAVAPQTEGVAGRRGSHFPQAGRSSQEGAECGQGCAEAWGTLRGAALRGSGGGGGACSAGAVVGGYPGRCALKEGSSGAPRVKCHWNLRTYPLKDRWGSG